MFALGVLLRQVSVAYLVKPVFCLRLCRAGLLPCPSVFIPWLTYSSLNRSSFTPGVGSHFHSCAKPLLAEVSRHVKPPAFPTPPVPGDGLVPASLPLLAEPPPGRRWAVAGVPCSAASGTCAFISSGTNSPVAKYLDLVREAFHPGSLELCLNLDGTAEVSNSATSSKLRARHVRLLRTQGTPAAYRDPRAGVVAPCLSPSNSRALFCTERLLSCRSLMAGPSRPPCAASRRIACQRAEPSRVAFATGR